MSYIEWDEYSERVQQIDAHAFAKQARIQSARNVFL